MANPGMASISEGHGRYATLTLGKVASQRKCEATILDGFADSVYLNDL